MRQILFSVSVDGEDIPLLGSEPGGSPPVGLVESCTVKVALSGQDEFRLVIQSFLAEGKDADNQAIEKAAGWIGKQVRISFGGSSGSSDYEGTVTDVQMFVDHGGRDAIALVGHGPLWFLSGVERFRTFTKKNFAAVVKEVLSAHQISVRDESESKQQFDFLVQHGETDLGFLDRVCRQAGEWLYFDGAAVFVGVASDHGGSPVRLEWGKHLVLCRAESRLAPLVHQAKSWHYETSTLFDKTSRQPRASGPAWASKAVDASLQMFDQPSMSIGGSYAAAKDVEGAVNLRAECHAGNTASLWGRTSRTGLVVGRCVDLAGVGALSGEYRVHELEHSFTSSNGYSCSFLAVPKAVRRPRPIAAPPDGSVLQVGTVEDNNDPEKLGRVKVKLKWHTEPTPWLRVLQVHAGKEGGDHGLYVIPEKGDEVLVGYECGDPDRPVVLGSLYHSKAKPDSKVVHASNDHKQFITRAGNVIRITDTKGQEEIHVATPDESNQLVFKAGSSPTILIKTKGSMMIEAGKRIEIKAGEAMTLSAPKIEVKGGEQVLVAAPKIENNAQQEHKVNGGAAAKVTAQQVEVSSGATLKVSAGATADLSASASMALKAPLIRLN